MFLCFDRIHRIAARFAGANKLIHFILRTLKFVLDIVIEERSNFVIKDDIPVLQSN